jgi:hypothetical protein
MTDKVMSMLMLMLNQTRLITEFATRGYIAESVYYVKRKRW